MKNTLTILVIVLGLICPTITVVKDIKFNQNCKGYLKQTADANSVELALDRLNKAIDYAEENNLTSGYTSVLWKTENENIEFWYKNLLTCRNELSECIESSQFEKTNVLMKVRESLTDTGEKGTIITVPPGLSRYPNNAVLGIFNIISCILLFFAIARLQLNL